MRNITIIDYGCGNVLSLHRAIEEIGFKNIKTKSFFMTKVWSAVKQSINKKYHE